MINAPWWDIRITLWSHGKTYINDVHNSNVPFLTIYQSSTQFGFLYPISFRETLVFCGLSLIRVKLISKVIIARHRKTRFLLKLFPLDLHGQLINAYPIFHPKMTRVSPKQSSYYYNRALKSPTQRSKMRGSIVFTPMQNGPASLLFQYLCCSTGSGKNMGR